MHGKSLSWQLCDSLQFQSPASHTIPNACLPSVMPPTSVFMSPPFVTFQPISNIKHQNTNTQTTKSHSGDSTNTSMRYNYFIPLLLLITAAVTEPIPQLLPRQNGKCDHNQGVIGNPACPAGACCSTEDWCGYGDAWCGTSGGSSGNGQCNHALGTHGNPACPPGACCSTSNWCGYGCAWCGGPVSPPDGSCNRANGGIYGNPSCPGGACCSVWGWCGYGYQWCS
jgi:hypothetical protein